MGAYAAQGDLFVGELDKREMKKPEEPKKMVRFPAPEFPREKQARERIRRRREAEPPPSVSKPEYIPSPEMLARVEPVVSNVFPESPRLGGGMSSGIPKVTQERRPTSVPVTVGMSGAERLVTMLIGGSGFAAAGMSVYHEYHYLVAAGKPSWVALITAVVMVVFSATIFAFPLRRRFFGWALRGLGIATVSFSIFSTVAVNYDQFTAQEEAETSVVRTNEAKRGELELLHVQMEGLEAQIEDLKREAAYWKDKSWARRDAADAALQTAYRERSALWQRITTTTEAAYPVTEVKSVFIYLTGLFHIRQSLLEFIFFCIPAVFYDLLAALAVNAVFCVTRRKEYP
ncbi:hypothetical protein Holit_01603 [Hollandina sp. SP2]